MSEAKTWQGRTMGTTYNVQVTHSYISDSDYKSIHHAIDSVLQKVNRQMSTYDPQSEISRFNSHSGTDNFQVSPAFIEVLQTALTIYTDTQGAFDITVAPLVNLWGFGTGGSIQKIPSDAEISDLSKKIGSDKLYIVDSIHIQKKIPELQLDLGAIAKGYGVDVVSELIADRGYQNYMAEIGGEVRVQGWNAQGKNWRIGVDLPEYAHLPGEKLHRVLSLHNVAVATSGDYRNFFTDQGRYYSHTIDPATGRPVQHGLASVTVIANSCMLADALATAVMVMGPDRGLEYIEKMSDVEAMLLVRKSDGSFGELQTKDFKNYIAQ